MPKSHETTEANEILNIPNRVSFKEATRALRKNKITSIESLSKSLSYGEIRILLKGTKINLRIKVHRKFKLLFIYSRLNNLKLVLEIIGTS